jgi:hypothetical protein
LHLLPIPTAYYLLPTTYCLLPTAYYLLPTTTSYHLPGTRRRSRSSRRTLTTAGRWRSTRRGAARAARKPPSSDLQAGFPRSFPRRSWRLARRPAAWHCAAARRPARPPPPPPLPPPPHLPHLRLPAPRRRPRKRRPKTWSRSTQLPARHGRDRLRPGSTATLAASSVARSATRVRTRVRRRRRWARARPACRRFN